MADGTQTQLMSAIKGIVLGQPLTVTRSQPVSALHGAAPISRTLLDEDGKTIRYEFTGRSWSGTVDIPSIVICGDDGEIQFVGLSEMRAARDAMILACSMAEVAL